jgi:hypothetical protein
MRSPGLGPRIRGSLAGLVLVYCHFITSWSTIPARTSNTSSILHPSQPPLPRWGKEKKNNQWPLPLSWHQTPLPATNQLPPPYSGETLFNPPPIPHLGLDSRSLPLDWNQTQTPTNISPNFHAPASSASYFGTRHVGPLHFWKRSRARPH